MTEIAAACRAAAALFASRGRPDLADKWTEEAGLLDGRLSSCIRRDPLSGAHLVRRLCDRCRAPFSYAPKAGGAPRLCPQCRSG